MRLYARAVLLSCRMRECVTWASGGDKAGGRRMAPTCGPITVRDGGVPWRHPRRYALQNRRQARSSQHSVAFSAVSDPKEALLQRMIMPARSCVGRVGVCAVRSG